MKNCEKDYTRGSAGIKKLLAYMEKTPYVESTAADSYTLDAAIEEVKEIKEYIDHAVEVLAGFDDDEVLELKNTLGKVKELIDVLL